jgi:hypothetical protein
MQFDQICIRQVFLIIRIISSFHISCHWLSNQQGQQLRHYCKSFTVESAIEACPAQTRLPIGSFQMPHVLLHNLMPHSVAQEPGMGFAELVVEIFF